MKHHFMQHRILNRILVLAMCVLLLCPLAVHASEAKRETVRVGYYPVSDYQETREDGTRCGFSYDYYIQLQKYTRWNYEFVEGSYADCMSMLMNGEIDVMSGLTASSDREDRLIFSEYSISNSQQKLYAREDDEHLFYESYDTFNGSRVGMVAGVKTEELEQYAAEHDFHVDIVTYNSYAELETALAAGEVDMVCGASLSGQAKTKIVARMKKQPLYYAVTRKKPELAAELDDALQKIIDNNPEFYTQMAEKYKINGANAAATYTREEAAYIQSGKPIYLIVNNDLPPISWLDKKTGVYKGISIDVAKKVEEYSGLKIIPILGGEFDRMAAEKPEIMGDALVLTADDNAWAENMSIMMTNHVIESTIVMIGQTGKTVDLDNAETVLALPKNYYISYCLKEALQGRKILYYDTVEECLNAVNRGKADATFENSLVARYYLSMQKYANLFIYAESGYAENLSYGVYIDSDTPLLSILDKSLLCIGTTQIGEIAIQYAHAEEAFSLEGFYNSNPALVISSIIICCGLLGGILFFRMKAVNAEKRRIQEEKNRQILQDALETAKDASEAKGNFLSRISHEIRTPLNAVIGYLSIARQPDSDREKVEHCLENSEIASRHLLSILNDVLDMSSIESGKLKLDKDNFDLRELLSNLQSVYAQQAANKGIAFELDTRELDQKWFVGDRMRVSQILINLVSNAIKFTEKGGNVLLRASQIDRSENKCRIKFEVADTGIGMSDAYRNRLFKPFEQESAKTAQKFGGTGLGLSIAWNLITMMGGSIEVKSKQGVGTTFTVLLSFDCSEIENQKVKETLDFSKLRVLVVDDQKNECDYVKNLLKQLGMKCDTVQSGEKAVQRILSRKQTDYRYRLVIMDWNMPEENGIDVIRDIREKADGEIPILLMTAYDISAIQKEALEAGASKVLSKPLFQQPLSELLVDLFGALVSEDEEEGTLQDLKGMHLLLAEDNEMNLEIAVEVLNRAGLVVDTAVNGEEAVKRFTESEPGTYQAILMDIQMPIMDGYEATRQIRASKHAQAKQIPIIATTANAFSEDVSAALACGMNAHIAKPIDYKKLYQALKNERGNLWKQYSESN